MITSRVFIALMTLGVGSLIGFWVGASKSNRSQDIAARIYVQKRDNIVSISCSEFAIVAEGSKAYSSASQFAEKRRLRIAIESVDGSAILIAHVLGRLNDPLSDLAVNRRERFIVAGPVEFFLSQTPYILDGRTVPCAVISGRTTTLAIWVQSNNLQQARVFIEKAFLVAVAR